ncbi:MAG TPA: hypothetical protein VFS00_29155, partial [Polyangiaceae bacterium]|nr:hypothetical protein [Polyangiaceae bacterium]
MSAPLRLRWAALAALLPALSSCREATQVKVDVWTDLPCEETHGTALFVGRAGDDLERKPPARVSLRCDPASKRLGGLVLVPTGDERDAELAFNLVTAVKVPSVDQCLAPAYEGCIVARRVLRYVPHTTLFLDVPMSANCVSVECDAKSTCYDADECRSSDIEDPDRCTTPGACGPDVLPPGGPAGGAG